MGDTSLIPGWVVPGIGEVGELLRTGWGSGLEFRQLARTGSDPSVPRERATSRDAAYDPSPNQGRISLSR